MEIIFKHTPIYWKRVWGDENSCIHFYDSIRLLTFAWDGECPWIEVCVDGVQETPVWLCSAPVGISGPIGDAMRAFEDYCREAIILWDETIGSDPNEDMASYHALINRDSVSEKYTVFPPVGVALRVGGTTTTERIYHGDPAELWNAEWHQWANEHNTNVMRKRLAS